MLFELWLPIIEMVMQFAFIAVILTVIFTFFYIRMANYISEEKNEKINDTKTKNEEPLSINKIIIWFVKIFRRVEQKGEEDETSILYLV